MKKSLFCALICGIVLFTAGFTQTYIHPTEFYNKVISTLKNNNCIEVKGTNSTEGAFKAFYKNNKLRIEFENYMGLNYKLITIYKNHKLFKYEQDAKSGIVVDLNNKKEHISSIIPIYRIFKWNERTGYKDFYVEGYTTKNGFNCRLLTNGSSIFSPQMCISEKYGIMVYEEFSSNILKDKSVEMNITEIKTGKDLFTDEIFNIDENIKIRNLEDIYKM